MLRLSATVAHKAQGKKCFIFNLFRFDFHVTVLPVSFAFVHLIRNHLDCNDFLNAYTHSFGESFGRFIISP